MLGKSWIGVMMLLYNMNVTNLHLETRGTNYIQYVKNDTCYTLTLDGDRVVDSIHKEAIKKIDKK